MEDQLDDFLAHYGVKGMKWGVRKDEVLLNKIVGANVKAAGGTRAERRALTKNASQQFRNYKKKTPKPQRKLDREKAIQEKIQYLLDEAKKKPTRAFMINNGDGIPTLVRGKEFLEAVEAGQAFNPVETYVTEIILRDRDFRV